MKGLAFVLVFIVAVATQDLCEDLLLGSNGQSLLTNGRPSDALKCFQQVAVDKPRAATLIGILKDLATVYSFTEYACASIPPYNTNVCIKDEIARIENLVNTDQYPSDYDFHADVAVSFRRLNDAHTTYIPPSGFGSCQINRAYGVELTNQASSAIFRGAFGLNGNFEGATIVTIDGLTPLEYFKAKANTLGIFRDPNVRFNGAVQGFFFESVDSIHLKDVADTETVVISLNGQTQSLTFTKNITCFGDRTSTTKITNLNNGVKRAGMPEMIFTQPDIHQDPLKKIREREKMLHLNNNFLLHSQPVNVDLPKTAKKAERSLDPRAPAIAAPLVGNPGLLDVLRVTSDSTFIGTRYRDIPVWKVQSFLPQNANEFLGAVLDSISESQARGDKNLIIDLSGNGGGSVCLNIILGSLLIRGWGGLPAVGESVPWNFIDVKKNTFMDAWINDAPLILAEFLDPANGAANTEAQWYNSATVTKNIGGNNTEFTKKGYWPSPCGSGLPVSSYFFDSIFLITDGTCGSACSQFESHLRTQSGVFAMSFGAFPGGIPDTSSFAGGNVLSWTVNLVPATAGSAQKATPLPTTAVLSFNHHATYQTATDEVPREFLRLEADLHSFLYSPLLLRSLNEEAAVVQEFSNVYETAVFGFGLVAVNSAAFFAPSAFVVLVAVLAFLF